MAKIASKGSCGDSASSRSMLDCDQEAKNFADMDQSPKKVQKRESVHSPASKGVKIENRKVQKR